MKKLLFALLFVWSSAFAISEELCISLIDAGDYSKAVQVGQELIRRNPNSYGAHACLTVAYFQVGDFQKSLEHAQALERLARNDEEFSFAYNRLGQVYSRLGDLDTALMYHMRHLSLSRKMEDIRGEAAALNNIALIYENKGDYQKALEYYMKSLEELQDYPRKRATTLNNIGIVYYTLGDYKNAERYLKQAIELSEKSGDFHGAGKWMLNLGDTYRRMKNYKLAEKLLSEGLERVKRVGDSYWEFWGYNNFTFLYFDMRDYKKSLEYAYTAYELGMRMGYNNSNAIGYISAILILKPELRAYLEKISEGDRELLKAVEEAESWEGVKELVAEANASQQQKQAPKKGSQKKK